MTEPADVTQLAGDVVAGTWRSAVDRCAEDARLAEAVSMAAARLLVERAAAHGGGPPEEAVWPSAQDSFVALSRIPGADRVALAQAFFDACTRERVSGEPTLLRQETLRWLLDDRRDEVESLVDRPNYHESPKPPWRFPFVDDRFVSTALWNLPGEEGARWLVRSLPQHDSFVSSKYTDMRIGKLPEWSAEDWIARLDALADAHLDPRPSILHVFGVGVTPPPRESAPAQVRLACVYAEEPTDYLVRMVASNVRSYRSSDPPADMGLFWWDATPEKRDLLRWIIELAGPPGAREPVVAAARAAGLIDAKAHRDLASAIDRPAWADHEVPWTVADVVEAGTVRTPDGRIAAGDPWWSFEGLPFVVDIGPGDYLVRVVIASHPVYGRDNAAAELVIDKDAVVERWDPVSPTDGGDAEGYIVEVGVGSFGPPETLCPGLGEELLPDTLFDSRPMTAEIDAGPLGSLVMFSVGPQHQDCRTWVGVTAQGNPAKLVTDLGLLDLDLALAAPPW